MKNELNAIMSIAYRDFIKFLRDKMRIAATFMFPLVFILLLGGSLDANLSEQAGYDFMTFVFTGVLGQILFQSAASGIISLIDDRESDYAQEIFIAPVSRHTILIGKIAGEALVALTQGFGVILIGIIIGIKFTLPIMFTMAMASIIATILGGAFGVMVMSMLPNQKAANQVFPFLLFPQFFAAGVFSPIKQVPFYIWIISRVAPMTYAVDLVRNAYYAGSTEYSKVILFDYRVDLTVIMIMIIVFISVGTVSFTKNIQNR